MPSTPTIRSVAFPPSLVLGASGRLGKMLRYYWNDQPVTWASRQQDKDITQIDPLGDFQAVEDAARGRAVILCLAGVTPGNGDLGLNVALAEAAIRASGNTANRPAVLLCSSAAVYGDGRSRWKETDQAAPVSPYGRAKLDMEHAAAKLGQELAVQTCCLRIGNVAGADAILAGGQPASWVHVMPDGMTPLRSYIGPGAFAQVLATLVSRARDLPEILNVALPNAVRMGALLTEAGLEWSSRPADQHVIERVELDTTLLENLVHFDKTVDTAEAIVRDWRSWNASGEAR